MGVLMEEGKSNDQSLQWQCYASFENLSFSRPSVCLKEEEGEEELKEEEEKNKQKQKDYKKTEK